MIRATNDTMKIQQIDPSIADSMKQCTVTVNDDRTQTQYPKEVQVILDDYADMFFHESYLQDYHRNEIWIIV